MMLELTFLSRRRNPPEIHTLAKNYIDLLYEEENNSRPLLIDDRQIRYLSVEYWQDAEPFGPEIWIRASPLASFAREVRLAAELRRSPDPPASLNAECEYWREHLQELESSLQSGITHSTDPFMLLFLRGQLQSTSLLRTERLLHSSILDLFRTPGRGGALEPDQSKQPPGGILTSPDISLELAKLPRVSGESDIFRREVCAALRKLTSSNAEVFPLRAKLGIVLIVTPPRMHNGDPGIDLDNLARRVVPLLHEILQPPGRRSLPDPSEVTEHLRPYLEAQSKPGRHLPKYHITRYEVIVLPRQSHDDPSGSVRLSLCDGQGGQTFASFVRSIVHEWEDASEDDL